MQQRNPNTPQTPYVVVAFQPENYAVVLSSEPQSYPVDITYAWSGASTGNLQEQLLSGLQSDGVVFELDTGESTLVVQVTIGAYVLEKTYYYHAE